MKSKKGKFKVFFDTLFTLPMVLPPTVLGFFSTTYLWQKWPNWKDLIYNWYKTNLLMASYSDSSNCCGFSINV